ncbi:hypothetical protein C2G38_2176307 [Gigaspora rosea]|uniref:Uncharacterized protein n=1 Tax=Gigaspora rosea TaxID=44941 RepID=A0A397VHT7_9GLOM|nr:hypothetical protein C2G38_2176307 [Gigaspora rosea]
MEEETRPDFDDIIILVTHDECIFSAYDGKRWLWLPKGEQLLRKKGQGRSVHISEFLTDIGGRLALREKDKIYMQCAQLRSTTYGDDIPQDMCFPEDYQNPDLRGCKQGRTDCCARMIIANQPDFRAQRGKVEEAIISAGHEEGLKRTVLQALESVPLTEIRRYARKSFRYMDVYYKGLTGKLAEHAVKKYRLHRRIQRYNFK